MTDIWLVMLIWGLLVLKHRWLITVVDWGYSKSRVAENPTRHLSSLVHGLLEAIGTALVFSLLPGDKIVCLLVLELFIGCLTAELEARVPVWMMLWLHTFVELSLVAFYGWAAYWVVLG